MKGKCETCRYTNMCDREEVTITAFSIDFNKDQTEVVRCETHQKSESPDDIYP